VKATLMTGLTLLLFGLPCSSQSGRNPSLAQCKTFAEPLIQNPGPIVERLNRDGTAGDLLVMSTQLARCQELHQKELSPASLDALNRVGYRLDALVMQRMSNFLERHKLMDRFNDEEEQRKEQRVKKGGQ
jgi:hypothetical protein